jgi:hypothetical protein
MAEEKNGGSDFKVVDRRSFTPEGERRPDVPGEESNREVSQPSLPQAEMGPEPYMEGEPGGFETLVSYLSTTAMFQLGLIPGPSGERIPADLPNARRTVDLLEVLQEKTRGNLTREESSLLENVLYELRMSIIELDKRRARKGK